jgi:hypothetical protein
MMAGGGRSILRFQSVPGKKKNKFRIEIEYTLCVMFDRTKVRSAFELDRFAFCLSECLFVPL